jgi:hypothetical protein
MALVTVDTSDLEKVQDALIAAANFFVKRDEMNGSVHLAAQVRYSPLTSTVLAERDRVIALLLAGPEE